MPKLLHIDSPARGGRRVCLAIPTYGDVNPIFMDSLLRAQSTLIANDIEYDIFILIGNCHVDDARNSLVRSFLTTKCSDLIFLDADLGFSGDDLISILIPDRDVLAGIYRIKQDDEQYPCVTLPGEIWSDSDGLIEVSRVPTGFLRIKRSVLERLARYAPTYLEKPDDTEVTYLIFERQLADGHRFSGDYAFCRKWKTLGGKIYVNPSLRLSHCGAQAWDGCFGSYLRKTNGVGLVGIQKIKQGNFSLQTMIDLFNDWGNPFAASPEMLVTCAELAKNSNGVILETGSGLSTLVMAAANPNITVHALEHDIGWHKKLQAEIWKQGLNNIVLHASTLINYGEYSWYDINTIPSNNFSLVVCDGPPRKLGSRKGLFDQCNEQICDAVVVMDDIIDPVQFDLLSEWSKSTDRDFSMLGEERPFGISLRRAA